MDNQEVKAFLDTIAYGDAMFRLNGMVYFVNGCCFDPKTRQTHFEVYRLHAPHAGIAEIVFACDCPLEEDCLQAFLEAKIWDGRTFWEAAPEMAWV